MSVQTLAMEAMLTAAAPPLLQPWQAHINGLLLGPDTPYEWRDRLEGFDELPALRSADDSRPAAHGDYSSVDYAEARNITFTLEVAAEQGVTLDEALADLSRALVPNPSAETVSFWYRLPGLGARRAEVKVRRRRTSIDASYEAGIAVVDVQLRAPDPFLYGAQAAASTGFQTLVGGLEFDLFTNGTEDTGSLEFGQASATGRMLLTNAGTAQAWPIFEVTGPTPAAGFEIVCVNNGKRIRFDGAVPPGSTLTIDTSAGTALLDAVADRGGYLVAREWFPIPAGGECETFFSPIGEPTSATLTALYAPTYW